MHPPGHLVKRPYQWSEVSSHGRTYLAIHHKEMEGTNTRRKAFIKQDSQTLQLVGDPTHCELTWDYDSATDSHVRRIWVSAPACTGNGSRSRWTGATAVRGLAQTGRTVAARAANRRRPRRYRGPRT